MTSRTVLRGLTAAVLLLGFSAVIGTAQAAGLKCECTDFDKCIVEKGRVDVPFSYDPKDMGGAYDALEAKAMKDADDGAATKGEAARKQWEASGAQCPAPCDPPEFWMKHGKPFAGAGGTRPGHGEGRSTWKVSYICKKSPPPPPPPPPPPKKKNFFGLFFGPGGVIMIDFGSGGFCDHWGCPYGYWDLPIFYGPVYWDGEWYEGPLYYRERHGHYEYYLHGDWHKDEWRGERPDWVGETHYGPAEGRDFYKSDEFKHWADKHPHRGEDGDRHEHGDGDRHERGDGDHWKNGDEKHDKDGDHGDHAKDKHDGDKDQDKDHDKDHAKDKGKDRDKDKGGDKDKDHKGQKDH